MQSTDKANEPKKRKKKRTIDKARVAENKKKAKAKKARMKNLSRQERERQRDDRSGRFNGRKVERKDITIIELGEDQEEELLMEYETDREEELLMGYEAGQEEELLMEYEAGRDEELAMESGQMEAAGVLQEDVPDTESAEAETGEFAKDFGEVPETGEMKDSAAAQKAAKERPASRTKKDSAPKSSERKQKSAQKSGEEKQKSAQKSGERKRENTQRPEKTGRGAAAKPEEARKDKSRKNNQKKNVEKIKKTAVIFAACIAISAIVGAGITFGVRRHLEDIAAANAVVEAMVHTEAVELAEYSKIQHQKESLRKNAGKGTSKALVDAARYMLDGVAKRPKPVEITEENALDFATIESCLINTETGKVDVKMSADGLAISDDGYYYLFEEKTYDTGLTSDEYIIEEMKDVDLTFSVNLNYNSASSRLFSKFVVAIKKDGEFMAVSRPRYITNPEAIAKYNPSFGNTKSKKGLLVDPNKLRGTELDDLGVKHAAYNIPMSKILGETTMAVYPTIYYNYNGRTYAFNGQAISEYDFVFSTLSGKGITTTAIILNDMAPGHTQLIHPKARSGNKRSLYYAFNGTEEAGTEYMAAIGSFLANRYSGTGHGTVMNWVISNEINARSEWNYIEYMDTESYVEEFAKPFRIFYNAILSVNGNARVYISLDQQWGKSLYSSNGYGSKEILDEFNRNIKACGNIDWGLAQHPYNYPLTSAKAWTLSSKAASYVTESENTPVLTIKNIHVLTNYLQKPEMLTDDGQVRHLILSEMGYTSTAGQDLQSASFAYAYKIIEANRYIDSVLLSRQTDASVEVQQGLALGINGPDGSPKSLYTVYKYIDTPQAAQYTDHLLPVIGISSWNEVIRQR